MCLQNVCCMYKMYKRSAARILLQFSSNKINEVVTMNL